MENFMDRLYSKISTGAGQPNSSNVESRRRENGDNKVEQLMNLIRENDSKQIECIAAMFNQESEEHEQSRQALQQSAGGIQQSVNGMQQSMQMMQQSIQEMQGSIQATNASVQETSASLQATNASVQETQAALRGISDVIQQMQTEQSYEQPQISGGISPEQFQDLEEHVHKENVKCYRNVQASVMEQAELQMEQTRTSVGPVKGMLITSLILNVATIAILIVHLLGVI